MFHYFDGHTPIFNSRLPGIYILSFGLPGTANTIYYVFRKKKFFGIFPFITFCGNFGDSP